MSYTLRCTGYERSNLQILRALGCTLYTVDGREIIDMESGVWAVGLGHNHPRINRVIREQLDRISHIGYRVSTPIQEEASEALLQSADMIDGRCVFLSSGSEAVEFAAQAARRVTKRPLLLTLADSFLGSYGSVGQRHPNEWHVFDWGVCVDCPQERLCNETCPHLREIPLDRIGALLFEAGSAQIRFPPVKLVSGLCNVVRAQGGWIIANEVTTGMGRTGRMYGFEHFDVRPDVVALGKGIGNGYPVSAVLMHIDASERLLSTGFRYAQSHQNDPMACTVALEVLRVLYEERLVERCAAIGAKFLRGLAALAAKHEAIIEARGRGLLLAISLVEDSSSFSRSSVVARLLEHGFLTGYKIAPSFVRFLPPLTIPEDVTTRLLETLDRIVP